MESAFNQSESPAPVPYLSRILIYPVKSLEPVSVQAVPILKSGALAGDRAFALFDSEGKFVNGKRHSRIHQLRCGYEPLTRTLTLRPAESTASRQFHLDSAPDDLHAWLSDFFGFPVTLRCNLDVGFPDDLDCPGPTVISTATLSEVASWFPPLEAGQLALRLRANLELSATPAFWEERLYTTKGSRIEFRVGDVLFHGNNPCQRCVVPTRDPLTGETYPDFPKIFARRRKQTLPPWTEASRFNHYYRLAINTLIPESEAGKMLRVGDPITVVGIVQA